MTGLEYSFQKLNVWQEAKILVIDIYHLLDKFPKFEKYALCDQILWLHDGEIVMLDKPEVVMPVYEDFMR